MYWREIGMRKNWVLLIVFIVVNIGVLSGCTQQQSPPPGTTNTITIKNFAFNPSTITIKAGANVTWTNDDSPSHQVKEDNGLFLSNVLGNGQSFTYTFITAGTYNYTCAIHPSMHGKVIVE
jgi:plastocyanin